MLFAIGGAVISGTVSRVDVGSSVMGAASANFGSNIRQRQYNEAVLLSESIHKTIKYSLEESNESNSLTNQLLKLIFIDSEIIQQRRDSAAEDGTIVDDIVFDMAIAGLADSIGSRFTVNLRFPQSVGNPEILSQGPIPAMPELGSSTTDDEDEDGNPITIETLTHPRIPRTITISAVIVFEVEVFLQGTSGRSITTLATYNFTGGQYSDDPDGLYSAVDDPNFIGEIDPDKPVDSGTWKMISFEIIESHPAQAEDDNENGYGNG